MLPLLGTKSPDPLTGLCPWTPVSSNLLFLKKFRFHYTYMYISERVHEARHFKFGIHIDCREY